MAGQGPNKPLLHAAFCVDTRAEVEAFYAAAIAAGGTDNGAPGVRAHHHPNHYGAFVRDPHGHNIEAVCHAPLEAVDAFRAGAKKGTRKVPSLLKRIRLTWRVPPCCWCPACG
ncbi:hypothetical protein ACUXIW_004485 [Ralstonia pickettii]|jgi:hypothetical protein|uniref:VOC domain-containing protein n=1 Tax=Ralstonia pickettii TaxID=329 RepID=A0ABN9I7G7_RALPI|nr:hypothetical protein R38712_05120 [Ralstonia pickettii]